MARARPSCPTRGPEATTTSHRIRRRKRGVHRSHCWARRPWTVVHSLLNALGRQRPLRVTATVEGAHAIGVSAPPARPAETYPRPVDALGGFRPRARRGSTQCTTSCLSAVRVVLAPRDPERCHHRRHPQNGTGGFNDVEDIRRSFNDGVASAMVSASAPAASSRGIMAAARTWRSSSARPNSLRATTSATTATSQCPGSVEVNIAPSSSCVRVWRELGAMVSGHGVERHRQLRPHRAAGEHHPVRRLRELDVSAGDLLHSGNTLHLGVFVSRARAGELRPDGPGALRCWPPALPQCRCWRSCSLKVARNGLVWLAMRAARQRKTWPVSAARNSPPPARQSVTRRGSWVWPTARPWSRGARASTSTQHVDRALPASDTASRPVATRRRSSSARTRTARPQTESVQPATAQRHGRERRPPATRSCRCCGGRWRLARGSSHGQSLPPGCRAGRAHPPARRPGQE